MKKLFYTVLVVGALLTVTLESHANTAFKSGFLLGGHAGYASGYGNFDHIFDDGLRQPLSRSFVSGKAHNSTGLMGILGGYRHVFNNKYTVGADITLNYYGRNELRTTLAHNKIDLFVNRVRRHISVIPRVSFGKVLGEKFHAAIGLGLGISRFNQQVDNTSGNVVVKSAQTKLAFVPSLQVDYACAEEFSLVGCIGYEIYQKVRKKFGPEVAPQLTRSSYVSSIRPKFLTLTAGIIFKL